MGKRLRGPLKRKHKTQNLFHGAKFAHAKSNRLRDVERYQTAKRRQGSYMGQDTRQRESQVPCNIQSLQIELMGVTMKGSSKMANYVDTETEVFEDETLKFEHF